MDDYDFATEAYFDYEEGADYDPFDEEEEE